MSLMGGKRPLHDGSEQRARIYPAKCAAGLKLLSNTSVRMARIPGEELRTSHSSGITFLEPSGEPMRRLHSIRPRAAVRRRLRGFGG